MREMPIRALALLTIIFSATLASAQVTRDYTTASLAWDPSSLVLIQDSGSFGRIVRLPDRELLCAYEWGNDIYARWSSDEGQSWNGPSLVATNQFGSATTPSLLVLQNGSVMLSYNERPWDGKHAYTIRICFSSDNGRTWGENQLVYQAGTTVLTACWEPALIQLPSGEVQLYFSNGQPYGNWWQQITMLSSSDNGATWSAPECAIYRPQARDGMAGPLLLNDGSMVISIEDNGLDGNFKPAIVPGPETGLGWPALLTMPAPSVYVGAPFTVQFPTGETLLSVQNADGRQSPTTQDYAQMVVYFGDPQARNFTSSSLPFSISPNASGLWNSLFMKNAVTVTAVSTTTINGVFGLWAIDGSLNYPDGPAAGVSAVVNAAGGDPGPVAPGELVSISGSGLIPAGADPSAVTVSFNGQAGSVSSASDTQIMAVVPNNVSDVADVVVQYQGAQTYPFPLGLVPSAPEIYVQQDGSTNAVAINQDGSVNSPSNTAPRGSTIEIWATGQGLVDNSTPNPKPQLPVSAAIGGVSANVAFAGIIYRGVLQVNLQVPPDAPTGDAVSLVLTVGSASSSEPATLAIR